MIRIKARLEPIPYKRPLQVGRRRLNPDRYREFKDALGWKALDIINGHWLKGAVRIRLDVYRNLPPTSLKYGDADNHLKAVLDALNGIAFADDRQIVSAQVELHRGEPRLEIELEEL